MWGVAQQQIVVQILLHSALMAAFLGGLTRHGQGRAGQDGSGRRQEGR